MTPKLTNSLLQRDHELSKIFSVTEKKLNNFFFVGVPIQPSLIRDYIIEWSRKDLPRGIDRELQVPFRKDKIVSWIFFFGRVLERWHL